jgi:hypothetical protein
MAISQQLQPQPRYAAVVPSLSNAAANVQRVAKCFSTPL